MSNTERWHGSIHNVESLEVLNQELDSPWPQSPISTVVLCLQPLPFAPLGHHTLPVVKLPWIRITKDWVSCPWSALRIGVSWCFLPLSALVLVGTSYPPCMKLYSDFISTCRPSRAAYKSSFMSSIDPRIMKNKRYQKHSMFTTCKCQSKWLVFFSKTRSWECCQLPGNH